MVEENLPNVDEAAEISIRLQTEREEKEKKEKSGKNHPSWNIAEEEKTILELINEDADKIYKNSE